MSERRIWGVRGATTVMEDTSAVIAEATRELLELLLAKNALSIAEIVSAVFTVTPDLRAAFPAIAARELGWVDVPLLSATEIDVPDAMPRCIRVLLHVEPSVPRTGVRHLYLHDARALRPEFAYP